MAIVMLYLQLRATFQYVGEILFFKFQIIVEKQVTHSDTSKDTGRVDRKKIWRVKNMPYFYVLFFKTVWSQCATKYESMPRDVATAENYIKCVTSSEKATNTI